MEPNIWIAFGAGVVTMFSPCFLPLIGPYLSFITGLSSEQLALPQARKIVLIETLLFILGFSVVFVSLGASATFLGNLLFEYQKILKIAGGSLILIFGLHFTGLLRFKFLEKEKRFHLMKKTGFLGSFFLGFAFAFGWTPCIGPILGSILTYAATQENVGKGIVLLSFYSLGIGLPFLAIALLFSRFSKIRNGLVKHSSKITFFAGIILIVFGLYLISDGYIREFLSRLHS